MGNFMWSAVDCGIIVLWWKFSSSFLFFQDGVGKDNTSYSFNVEISVLLWFSGVR